MGLCGSRNVSAQDGQHTQQLCYILKIWYSFSLGSIPISHTICQYSSMEEQRERKRVASSSLATSKLADKLARFQTRLENGEWCESHGFRILYLSPMTFNELYIPCGLQPPREMRFLGRIKRHLQQFVQKYFLGIILSMVS